ncbi:hypothetical protein J0H58_37880 [bacterium]|nr:hypothetical protein [bacterium]
MHVKPNQTTAEAEVVGVHPAADGYGADVTPWVRRSPTEKADDDFIRPEPGARLTAFTAAPAAVTSGGHYRFRLRLNADPGCRVVVRAAPRSGDRRYGEERTGFLDLPLDALDDGRLGGAGGRAGGVFVAGAWANRARPGGESRDGIVSRFRAAPAVAVAYPRRFGTGTSDRPLGECPAGRTSRDVLYRLLPVGVSQRIRAWRVAASPGPLSDRDSGVVGMFAARGAPSSDPRTTQATTPQPHPIT